MSPLFTPAAGQDGALADATARLAALSAAVKELRLRMDEVETTLSKYQPPEIDIPLPSPTQTTPKPDASSGPTSGSK